MHFRKFRPVRGLSALALACVLLAQQSSGPGEVSGKSVDYHPPARTPLIRSEVNIVEVPVVVRDSKNQPISGLDRGTFHVTDAGKPAELVSFHVETGPAQPSSASAPTSQPTPPATSAAPTPSASPASAAPKRLIALLFDNLNIPEADLLRAKPAAEKFVKESLAPGDRAAVVTTAFPKTPVFTADSAELVKQIDAVRSLHRSFDEGAVDCVKMNSYEAYLIVNRLDPPLYAALLQQYASCTNNPVPPHSDPLTPIAERIWEDARANSESSLHALAALVDSMSGLDGRRMVVLTSSGFLTGNLEQDLDDLTRKARMSGVVIDSLESRGLYAAAAGPDLSEMPATGTGKAALQRQAAQLQNQSRRMDAPDDGLAAVAIGTGGRFYQNSNDLTAGYRNLAAVPAVTYILGISVGAKDGKFHPLKVQLTGGQRGSVEARPGYMALLPTAPPVQAIERPIDREFLDGGTVRDVPANIIAIPRTSAATPGTPAVRVMARIDLGHLTLVDKDSRRTQELRFIASVMDSNGKFLSGKEGEMQLALKETTYHEYAAKGISMSLDLDAPPGKYIVRGVLQEGSTGKFTAMNQSIEIH